MTLQELRALDPAALDSELTALLREQFSQRMQRATGQLTVTHGLKKTRRNIARIYTLKREKEKSAK